MEATTNPAHTAATDFINNILPRLDADDLAKLDTDQGIEHMGAHITFEDGTNHGRVFAIHGENDASVAI